MTTLTDEQKVAEDRAEFQRRLVIAMEAMSTAARAVHEARLMSPTGLDLQLLRTVAARATDLVADLHIVASADEVSPTP